MIVKLDVQWAPECTVDGIKMDSAQYQNGSHERGGTIHVIPTHTDREMDDNAVPNVLVNGKAANNKRLSLLARLNR